MAVERNQRVMDMVESTLRENPDVKNDVLHKRASEIDPSISELSARSFNARYPLQVKRNLAQEKERGTTRTNSSVTSSDDLRARVRKALLDFAKDVTKAGDRGKVVEVVRDVDSYVDRVLGYAQDR